MGSSHCKGTYPSNPPGSSSRLPSVLPSIHPPCFRYISHYRCIIISCSSVVSSSVFTRPVPLRFSPSGRTYTFVSPPVYIRLSYDIYLYYFPSLLQPALE